VGDRHGFCRDVDFDASFITPWAVRFRKRAFEIQTELARSRAPLTSKAWWLARRIGGRLLRPFRG